MRLNQEAGTVRELSCLWPRCIEEPLNVLDSNSIVRATVNGISDLVSTKSCSDTVRMCLLGSDRCFMTDKLVEGIDSVVPDELESDD